MTTQSDKLEQANPPETEDGTPAATRHLPELPTFHGYGPLVLAAILFAFTTYIAYGIATMEVPDSAEAPGPQFYPLVLVIISYVLCVLLIIDVIRKPSTGDEPRYVTPVGEYGGDARLNPETARRWSLLGSIAVFIVFIIVLEPLGWIISAALLFAGFSYALGHRAKPWENLAVGIVVSSAVQVGFSAGLGLNLPAGVLGGLF